MWFLGSVLTGPGRRVWAAPVLCAICTIPTRGWYGTRRPDRDLCPCRTQTPMRRAGLLADLVEDRLTPIGADILEHLRPDLGADLGGHRGKLVVGQIDDGGAQLVCETLFPLALILFGDGPAGGFERFGGGLEGGLIVGVQSGERLVRDDHV